VGISDELCYRFEARSYDDLVTLTVEPTISSFGLAKTNKGSKTISVDLPAGKLTQPYPVMLRTSDRDGFAILEAITMST